MDDEAILKIHGYVFSLSDSETSTDSEDDDDSSAIYCKTSSRKFTKSKPASSSDSGHSSGLSDFDDEYFTHQPPPISIGDCQHLIVKIRAKQDPKNHEDNSKYGLTRSKVENQSDKPIYRKAWQNSCATVACHWKTLNVPNKDFLINLEEFPPLPRSSVKEKKSNVNPNVNINNTNVLIRQENNIKKFGDNVLKINTVCDNKDTNDIAAAKSEVLPCIKEDAHKKLRFKIVETENLNSNESVRSNNKSESFYTNTEKKMVIKEQLEIDLNEVQVRREQQATSQESSHILTVVIKTENKKNNTKQKQNKIAWNTFKDGKPKPKPKPGRRVKIDSSENNYKPIIETVRKKSLETKCSGNNVVKNDVPKYNFNRCQLLRDNKAVQTRIRIAGGRRLKQRDIPVYFNCYDLFYIAILLVVYLFVIGIKSFI